MADLDLDLVDDLVLEALSPYASVINPKTIITECLGMRFLAIVSRNPMKLEGIDSLFRMELRFHPLRCRLAVVFEDNVIETEELKEMCDSFNKLQSYFEVSVDADSEDKQRAHLSLNHYYEISSEEESAQITLEFLANLNNLICDCRLIALTKSSLKVSQNR